MSKDIFVIVEQRDNVISKVGIELIGEATKLAKDLEQKVVAVLLGSKIKDKAHSLISVGADEVIYIEDPILEEYVTEPYTKALSLVIKEYDPEIVLIGATSIGRDLAPRIASRIDTGLTADCTKLDIDPETKLLRMTRPAFGGNIMATILCKEYRPQMATVRPGVMRRLDKDETKTGTVKEFKVDFSPEDMNVVIRDIVKLSNKSTDITESKCLISGGRGIGTPEAFNILRELAALIGGEVSSSRANVDAGWIAKDRQVGQTGKTVRPELYMACGISGAIQHIAGMEDSEFTIAINKNDTASIFDVSDIGIVGDVKVIVPKLIEEIKKYKTKQMSEMIS